MGGWVDGGLWVGCRNHGEGEVRKRIEWKQAINSNQRWMRVFEKESLNSECLSDPRRWNGFGQQFAEGMSLADKQFIARLDRKVNETWGSWWSGQPASPWGKEKEHRKTGRGIWGCRGRLSRRSKRGLRNDETRNKEVMTEITESGNAFG